MKTRFQLIPLFALASAIALPVGATSGTKQVAGEVGFTTHSMRSATTRSEVLNELESWKRNPVTADGWREVGGEVGWIFVGIDSAGKTRAAVIEEMFQARRNPVSASGWLNVGGEVGAVYVGVPGQSPSAANTPPPAAPASKRTLGGLSRSGHRSAASQMGR